ncbi:MAG: ABC transporter ATP-binding protein [bacterium]|nr:ABC transporter ATP-binding protein [bacterium]
MKLELKNLTLQYNGKPPLFEGLHLTLESGDFALIQGPSGSGKSSFLRLLNRLQEPAVGEILIDGKPITQHDVTHLRRRIGYVQQTPIMVVGTVRDNLTFPFQFKIARGQKIPTDEDLQQKLNAYLLSDIHLDDPADELSVGQKQRIALIRSLLVQPELLLCDEPTSALDDQSREIVETELERANQDTGAGVILVTHLDFQPQTVHPRKFALDKTGLQETPS